MNKKIIFISLLTALLFCSCSKKTLFEESRTFANDTWLRFQPEQFTVNATSTDDCYNFNLTITFDTSRFHGSSLPIMMTLESPDHETRTLFSTIMLRTNQGAWLGNFDNNGNLVITQQIRQFYFFNVKGNHSINLSQRTSKYEIHGIKGINLKLDKVELDYPE